MSNIVEAQNRILTNCFGVKCHISKFEINVENMTKHYGVVPVRLHSDLEFITNEPIALENFNKQGVSITNQEVMHDGVRCIILYEAAFFYRSNLKNKAMLKYN